MKNIIIKIGLGNMVHLTKQIKKTTKEIGSNDNDSQIRTAAADDTKRHESAIVHNHR